MQPGSCPAPRYCSPEAQPHPQQSRPTTSDDAAATPTEAATHTSHRHRPARKSAPEAPQLAARKKRSPPGHTKEERNFVLQRKEQGEKRRVEIKQERKLCRQEGGPAKEAERRRDIHLAKARCHPSPAAHKAGREADENNHVNRVIHPTETSGGGHAHRPMCHRNRTTLNIKEGLQTKRC
ncbi:hypothetical protein NDU88_003469 [Pleurodeles waltl]|uniref:Uncharacterized protein n=1 Tax=Pleurodeles waltl TaxID=8319 RepID=A0AAV7MQP0_PLEWA|nr:hypothetical protein NDU88_003469 [Pleurodeles waltl]